MGIFSGIKESFSGIKNNISDNVNHFVDKKEEKNIDLLMQNHLSETNKKVMGLQAEADGLKALQKSAQMKVLDLKGRIAKYQGYVKSAEESGNQAEVMQFSQAIADLELELAPLEANFEQAKSRYQEIANTLPQAQAEAEAVRQKISVMKQKLSDNTTQTSTGYIRNNHSLDDLENILEQRITPNSNLQTYSNQGSVPNLDQGTMPSLDQGSVPSLDQGTVPQPTQEDMSVPPLEVVTTPDLPPVPPVQHLDSVIDQPIALEVDQGCVTNTEPIISLTLEPTFEDSSQNIKS